MTPERREELRRAEDALISARYNLDRKNYLATIAEQEDRIKALELLLVRACDCILNNAIIFSDDSTALKLIAEINAILPATEGDKNG